MLFSKINFCGKPQNYKKIDNFISRSAQPNQEDFKWLKKQGVTDIINFRTAMFGLGMNEKDIVEDLGMTYHNIPSYTSYPTAENIDTFMKITEDVKKNNGKAHIHCKAGADRTGMYSFVYETINHISNSTQNLKEWFQMGHHSKQYPDLVPWTLNYLKKFN